MRNKNLQTLHKLFGKKKGKKRQITLSKTIELEQNSIRL